MMNSQELHSWLLQKGMNEGEAKDVIRKVKSYDSISNSRLRVTKARNEGSVERILQTITDLNVMNKALHRTEYLVKTIRSDAADQIQHYISMIYRNWEPRVGEGLLMINWTNKEYWKSFIVDIKGKMIKPHTKNSFAPDIYFSVDPDNIESIDSIKKLGVVFAMLPARELIHLSKYLTEIK